MWGMGKRAKKEAGEKYGQLVKNAVDDYLSRNPEPVTVILMDETWRFSPDIMGTIPSGLKEYVTEQIEFHLGDIRIDEVSQMVPRTGAIEISVRVRMLPYWDD
jgi:hypothetical protein